jgi:FixJ family two-component response regulator
VTVPSPAVDAAVEAIRRGPTDVPEEPMDDRDAEESIAVALAQARKPPFSAE